MHSFCLRIIKTKQKLCCAVLKSQDEDAQMMTEVDLFISTKAVKVLNADTQVSVRVSSTPPPRRLLVVRSLPYKR